MQRDVITRLARDQGFEVMGFAPTQPTPRMPAYDAWIDAGHHGHMEWMRRAREDRADPRARLPSAKTAVVMAMDYRAQRPPDPGGLTGKVACYAWGRDYHNLIGKRLKKLRKRLWAEGVDNWGGVDTAPIVERAWAQLAGVGFIGKNSLTIRPGTTSWFFLAVLFIDQDLAPDPPVIRDHCGTCARCITGCPTGAIVQPYVVDARRCISYWTIESPTLPPRALRAGIGRWVFGCDDCQEVCPHNARPHYTKEADFQPRNAWIDLPDLLRTPDEVLLERYRGTPLRRPGAAGLKRNALLALAHMQDDSVMPLVRQCMQHAHPLVRAAAVYCARSLGEQRLPLSDPDDMVEDEIYAKVSPPDLTVVSGP